MATPLGLWAQALQRRENIQDKDKNVGSALKDDQPSLSSFISTLIPILLVASIMIVLFLLLRGKLKRNYQPRTYLGSLRPQERTPEVPGGLFNWIGAVRKMPDSFVLNHHSLDAFLLLRYLKITATICLVGCIITWPVLFPINITASGYQKQLNLLSIANITDSDKNRLYAHVFIAMIFYGFFFYTIARETIFYINLRQAYLLSPLYANRISSRTVLFTSVPDDYLNEAKLRRMFGKAVKNIWIANECDEIEKLVEERDKVAFKLEAAEIKLIKQAAKARAKATKKGTAPDEEVTGDANGESGSVAARWVQPKQRPTHRLKFLIGKKVDTINWCRSELERLVPQIDALQATYRAGEADFICSVFIEFYTQTEAQAAFQSLAHHQALHMAPRFIGVNPEQVIWKNLKINWASRVVRNIITTGFVVLLIIFWSIPVGAVGAISNINSLKAKVPFIKTIIDPIPPAILGVIQGLLPGVLLAVLMALLPIILRFMSKKAGCPTLAAVELRTQSFYFLFQVIQVFLVSTFASAASAVSAKIVQAPGNAPVLLASNIPHASNYFLSYFIVQCLTVSAVSVAQLVGVIVFRLLSKILDNTPRKMFKRFTTLGGLGWGTVFPIYTNLCVIALSYAVISPLILGFGAIGLYLLYLAYRYNLLFVYNATIDTKGLVYPRALQQTTTGAYIGMVCLVGLFGVNKAPGPAILMVAFLILVILFHVTLNSATGPLMVYLPKSLQAEEESLLALEDGQNDGTTTGAPMTSTTGSSGAGKEIEPAPHKKPNAIVKWLKPHVFTDYQTLRRLIPRDFAEISYDQEIERDAYYHPAIASPTPILWIPRDPMGISRQECQHSSKVAPMTDEGAWLDEKNNIMWDQDSGRPPVYKEKIYY